MRKLTTGFAVVAVACVAACSDSPLAVQDNNDPDIGRVLSTGRGIEQVIGTSYQSVFNNVHDLTETPQLNALSLESYGTVANYGMNLRAGLPRVQILNARGNQTAAENFGVFINMQKLSRLNATAIASLDKFVGGGASLGSAGRNARARAFAWMSLALTKGYVGLTYDSAAVVEPTTPTDATDIPALSDHGAVVASALADLDSAIAVANAVPASEKANFTLPSTWINGNSSIDVAQFVRIARSFKARFRAGVARTPTERGAVDWNAVIADATNGITADLKVTTSNQAGWSQAAIVDAYRYAGWGGIMSPFYVGMADTTGALDNWLQTPMLSRAPFLIQSADKRFPVGATRSTQQAASTAYFRNRATGDDIPADPWGNSYYDNVRFNAIRSNSDRTLSWPDMTKAEIDLLAAEGYLRTNQVALALPLINNTRVANGGLPALSGQTASTDIVPGTTGCVPRVPTGPSYTTTACGTVFEAMKWEKRMETLFTGYAQWFFDGRGWGDLVTGTPLEFPVPYQEMDARAHPFYNLGGVGGASAAAKGTYGY